MGDLTQKIKSYPISHDAEINTITGTKYIHYGDIHTGKLKRITNEKILPNINDNNYIPLKSGDVIVADASEDYKGIADACVIDLMKEHYKIVSGLHTIVFRPNERLKSDFLYTYFHTPIFKHYGYRVGTGLKVFGITYNNLSNMEIKLPKIDEQNKVYKIINIVTNIITLQQRKEKQIKLLKKAMLQTLFTTKTVPQLRFKGFTDNWEQHKLNSFLVEYKKKTKINNQYPVLTSSRQGIFFQKDYYDGNQIASKNNIGYNIVPRNYFTYRHMSDDTIFHFNINTLCDYGIVSTLYPVFTTNNQLSSSWLYYYLNYGNDMKRYALLQKQGGSRTYMYLSKLKNMSGHIPSVKEQDNVAKMLLKIDNLSALQQNKTKKLENLKQFLLQNMFI